MTMNSEILNHVKRLKTIAEIGLLYCNTDYDKERYLELRDIGFEMFNLLNDSPNKSFKESIQLPQEYPTPKVDIRGIVLSADNQILLVKESLDNKWSLPGGWADVGSSPKEAVIKEFKEETGLTIVPEKLLAVFDKKMHPHPAEWLYVYKLIFYCSAKTAIVNKGFDILDVGYFNIDNLPELSEHRILESQIRLVYDKIIAQDFTTYFD